MVEGAELGIEMGLSSFPPPRVPIAQPPRHALQVQDGAHPHPREEPPAHRGRKDAADSADRAESTESDGARGSTRFRSGDRDCKGVAGGVRPRSAASMAAASSSTEPRCLPRGAGGLRPRRAASMAAAVADSSSAVLRATLGDGRGGGRWRRRMEKVGRWPCPLLDHAPVRVVRRSARPALVQQRQHEQVIVHVAGRRLAEREQGSTSCQHGLAHGTVTRVGSVSRSLLLTVTPRDVATHGRASARDDAFFFQRNDVAPLLCVLAAASPLRTRLC